MTTPLSILVIDQPINKALLLKNYLWDEQETYHGRRIILETAAPYGAINILRKNPHHLVVMTYDPDKEDPDEPSKFDLFFNTLRVLYPSQKILILTPTERTPTHKIGAGTRCIPELFSKKQVKCAVEKLLNGSLDDALTPTQRDLPEEAEQLRTTSFAAWHNTF